MQQIKTVLFCFVLLFQNSSFAASDEMELDVEQNEFDLDFTMSGVDEASTDAEKPWRLIFAWRNGVDAQNIRETRSHRFDSRMDWGQLVFDDYFVKLDGKLIFRLPGDDNQTNQQKTELDGRLKELYIQRSLPNWTITAGFQTIILGEMDTVQVADLFSPWDYSEFAFTSPEDARLGQFVINSEWYYKKSRWQLLYSPWPLSNRYPGESVDFFRQIFGNQPVIINDNQPKPFQQNEFLAKWTSNIAGSDISFLYASLLSNNPTFNMISSNNSTTIRFDSAFPRFNLLVGSANYSAGNFLWKLETAFKQNIQFQSASNQLGDVWDLAVGSEYDANGAWNMSLEMLNQVFFTSSNQSSLPFRNNTQIVGRWSKNWLNQTLSTIIFGSYQVQYGDTVTSLSASYAIDDSWTAMLVATLFESTDSRSPGQFTKNWDQITAKVSFSY